MRVLGQRLPIYFLAQGNYGPNCQYLMDHRKKQGNSKKCLHLLHWLGSSLWLCGSQQTAKFSEVRIPDHLTYLLRNLYAGQEATIRTEHRTTNWFKTGNVKAVYCHPAYLTSMQSTSCKMLGWMKHKLESRFLGEISTTSDM